MNKIIKVNIGGIAFNLDADAYVDINTYLELLCHYFHREESGKEIIADIEARIAELLSKNVNTSMRVIGREEVSNIIATLGHPDAIAGVDSDNTDVSEKNVIPRPRKRLYRDVDHRIAAGVFAGLGIYLGVSSIALRILWIALLFLPYLGVLLFLGYFILWILIPAASTTVQKLEMRGLPVNISNIEKGITQYSSPLQRINSFMGEAGNVFASAFKAVGRVLVVFICILLCIAVVSIVIGIALLYFAQDALLAQWVDWDLLSLSDFMQHILQPQSYRWLLVCLTTLVLLPILGIFTWSIKIIKRRKFYCWPCHLCLMLLWFAAAFGASVILLYETEKYRFESDTMVEVLPIKSYSNLYIICTDSLLHPANIPFGNIYFDKQTQQFYGKPYIHICSSSG